MKAEGRDPARAGSSSSEENRSLSFDGFIYKIILKVGQGPHESFTAKCDINANLEFGFLYIKMTVYLELICLLLTRGSK